MAQQRISLIKFRRGTKDQRTVTKFEEGEPVYETDTRRLFIGVGDNDDAQLGNQSIGGTLTGNLSYKNNTNAELTDYTIPSAYEGDILFNKNKIWRKASAGWDDVSPKVDGVTIIYDNENKLTAVKQNTTINSGNGIEITSDNTVSVKLNGDTLAFIDGGLQINSNSITVDQINTNTFYSRHFKRVNDQYQLNLNDSYFTTPNNNTGVTIKGVNAGDKGDTLTNNIGSVNAIINDRIGNQNTGGDITLDENNNIVLNENLINKNTSTGQVVGFNLAVDTTFISDGSDTQNPGNPCEKIGEWSGTVPLKQAKIYNRINLDHATEYNSGIIKSAGFIVINSGITKNGRAYGKLAIPVYRVPEEPVPIYYKAPKLYGYDLINTSVVKGNTVASSTNTSIALETQAQAEVKAIMDPSPFGLFARLSFRPINSIDILTFSPSIPESSTDEYEISSIFGKSTFIPNEYASTNPVLIENYATLIGNTASSFNASFSTIDFTGKLGYAVYVFVEGFNMGTTVGNIANSNITGIQSIDILATNTVDLSQVETGDFGVYPTLYENSHGSNAGTKIINIPTNGDKTIKFSSFIGYIAFPESLGQQYMRGSSITGFTLGVKSGDPIKISGFNPIKLY